MADFVVKDNNGEKEFFVLNAKALKMVPAGTFKDGMYKRTINNHQLLYKIPAWTMDEKVFDYLMKDGTCKTVVYYHPDKTLTSKFADWVQHRQEFKSTNVNYDFTKKVYLSEVVRTEKGEYIRVIDTVRK